MAWVVADLRGQRVFARANDAGALEVEGGRVEIRYRPTDGRRYLARRDNLKVIDPTPLPDTTCGPASEPDRPAPARKGSRRSASAPETPRAIPADAVIVYADGACSGNPGPSGIGVVVLDGSQRTELSEYLGEGTNNIAELTAIRRALELAPGDRPLVIHTDSSYSIGVLQKGWRAKANVSLVESIRSALEERRRVRLVYVPGHSGVPLNERADELARQAVKERRTARAVTSVPNP